MLVWFCFTAFKMPCSLLQFRCLHKTGESIQILWLSDPAWGYNHCCSIYVLPLDFLGCFLCLKYIAPTSLVQNKQIWHLKVLWWNQLGHLVFKRKMFFTNTLCYPIFHMYSCLMAKSYVVAMCTNTILHKFQRNFSITSINMLSRGNASKGTTYHFSTSMNTRYLSLPQHTPLQGPLFLPARAHNIFLVSLSLKVSSLAQL